MARHYSKYIMPMILLFNLQNSLMMSVLLWLPLRLGDWLDQDHPANVWWSRFANLGACDSRSHFPRTWIIPVPPWPVWGCGTENEKTSCFTRIVFEWGICFPNRIFAVQVEGVRGPQSTITELRSEGSKLTELHFPFCTIIILVRAQQALKRGHNCWTQCWISAPQSLLFF